jgi:mono/diheme cytochrome c family protein
MNTRPSSIVVTLCLSLGLSLVACSGGGISADGDVARGEAAVKARDCARCHRPDMSGSGERLDGSVTMYPDTVAYSSNLTSDKETGLGNWTDEEIDTAMRRGLDREGGKPMCEPMPIYKDMPDQEAADIIAYLRTVKPQIIKRKESVCPSMPK